MRGEPHNGLGYHRCPRHVTIVSEQTWLIWLELVFSKPLQPRALTPVNPPHPRRTRSLFRGTWCITQNLAVKRISLSQINCDGAEALFPRRTCEVRSEHGTRCQKTSVWGQTGGRERFGFEAGAPQSAWPPRTSSKPWHRTIPKMYLLPLKQPVA